MTALERLVDQRGQAIPKLVQRLRQIDGLVRQPAEELEYLQAALTLAGSVGSHGEQSWLQSGLAEAHRLIGDPDGALAHVGRARRHCVDTLLLYCCSEMGSSFGHSRLPDLP